LKIGFFENKTIYSDERFTNIIILNHF
jgi:hypothetical protein